MSDNQRERLKKYIDIDLDGMLRTDNLEMASQKSCDVPPCLVVTAIEM